MNDKPCVISINGTDYYYPCDSRDNIIVVDGSLINVGSAQITMYRQFPTYGDNTSGYPRIILPSNTRAYYRANYQANYTTLNVNSIEFKTSSYGMSVYLMIVLIGVMVLQLFKR